MSPSKIWSPRRAYAVVPQLPERRSFLKRLVAFTAAGTALFSVRPREARADGDPWIGEIALVAFNFPPVGWATCDGQLLSIAQNTALFSLLGTTYGGNGQTTFALPDLRGRVPIHMGQGPGLTPYTIGEVAGTETVTLLSSQMPAHSHVVSASTLNGTSDVPTGAFPAKNAAGVPSYVAAANANMAGSMIGPTGGNQPHDNRQPFLTMNYIIALQGIVPSRS